MQRALADDPVNKLAKELNPMRMKPSEFYTVNEVAQLTRLAPRHVRALIADGRLASVRLRGVRRVLIPASAVAMLLGQSPLSLRERG
jgi:excisionase family DNA binding protein